MNEKTQMTHRAAGTKKAAPLGTASKKIGGDLLSHAVTHAVPSAQEGLTAVFGMETGVTPPLSPPKI